MTTPVNIKKTFECMMQRRVGRVFGKTWGNYKMRPWWKYGFNTMFMLMVLFGSVTFLSTGDHGGHPLQMIVSLDWETDGLSITTAIVVFVAYSMNKIFANLLRHVSVAVLVVLALITLAQVCACARGRARLTVWLCLPSLWRCSCGRAVHGPASVGVRALLSLCVLPCACVCVGVPAWLIVGGCVCTH